jgi:hypothetical protein
MFLGTVLGTANTQSLIKTTVQASRVHAGPRSRGRGLKIFILDIILDDVCMRLIKEVSPLT